MLDTTYAKEDEMSTAPWGTMNGWLRLEAEQRGAWRRQRVQDLRAAQVVKTAAPAPKEPLPRAAPSRALVDGCAQAA